MASGVYMIRNEVSGSCYVGSAVNIAHRWAAHRCSLRAHGKSPPKLQRAWDRYGENAFSFSVLILCSSDNVLTYEQLAIDAMAPKYNTRLVAKSNAGVKWSAATNAKKARKDTQVYTVRGVSGALPHLAAHFGIVGYGTAAVRVRRGWTVEAAITTPPVSKQEIGRRAAATHKRSGTHPNHRVETAYGVTAPLIVLHQRFGVTKLGAFRRRLALGWGVERALTAPQTRGVHA